MEAGSDRGVALVIVLTSMLLMMALGAGLVLITSTETTIAANYRLGNEAFYAADAALERAIGEVSVIPDWTPLLDGSVRSAFVDGASSGPRRLADGSAIDLGQITNLANCQKFTACTSADLAAVTSDRPWGANNPRWTLYASGRLADSAATGSIDSPFYVVAFVGDDGSENDGDPLRDGAVVGGVANPGRGVMVVRAEAFGPRNAHKVAQATIARISPPPDEIGAVRVVTWREVR